jgi:hypothetical protein
VRELEDLIVFARPARDVRSSDNGTELTGM